MRRTSIMTLGIVLIFVGIQLNLVQTYVLTPRFSNFLSESSSEFDSIDIAGVNSQNTNNSAFRSPYYQASFPSGVVQQQSNQLANNLGFRKTISTPSWLCWPVLFMGTVVFLHGLSVRRD